MLRITGRMIRIAAVAMAMCFAIVISSEAFAGVPVGVNPADPSHCIIKSPRWGNKGDPEGLSLSLAAFYANDPNYGMCQRLIDVKTDIQVKDTLVITRSGVTIDGHGHTLDMNAFAPSGASGCAIYVSGSDVKIRNLKINGPSGNNFNGICFMGADGTAQGVEVLGGKNGIYLGKDATGNRVLPDSSVKAGSEFGIVDLSGESGVNSILMNNRIAQKSDMDNLSDKVDEDGFVDWMDNEFLSVPEMESDFTLLSTGSGTDLMEISLAGRKGILQSTLPIVPLVTKIEDVSGGAGTRYEVFGVFKRSSSIQEQSDTEGLAGFEPMDCSGAGEKSVDRLAVFMVKDVEYKLVGVVGKTPAFGIISDTGTFDFIIDKSKNPDLITGSRFVLVPINQAWQLVGRAGNYKSFGGESDCIAGTAPDIEGSGPGGSSSGGEGSMLGFSSEAECNQKYKFAVSAADAKKDSDLDGIPDFLEMRVVKNGSGGWVYDPKRASCSCADTLTCWYMTDTDGDGIPDGKDNYKLKWNDYLNVAAATDVTQPVAAMNTDQNYPAGAADLIPDVKDTDSDKDGIEDGMEDRSRLFRRTDGTSVKAYLYKPGSVNFEVYPKAPGGNEKVDCTSELDTEELKNRGIRWGIYRAGGNAQTYISQPIRYNMFDPTPLPAGTGLYILACINETVASPNAFNGEFEKGMGETDARSPDTDKDCVCDGGDVGCAAIDQDTFSSVIDGKKCLDSHNGTPTRDNPLWMNDHCPLDPQLTNECTPSCIDYETLNYVKIKAPEWLKHDSQNKVVEPLELKDDDDNGVKDLFDQTKAETDADTGISWNRPDWEKVVQACSDIDNDGIPDCVERFDGLCGNSSAQTIYLDPYKADTDGDGLLDGMRKGSKKEDICPFKSPAAGQSDEFTTSGNPNYSCDPNAVYTQGTVQKILSCFLDRDDDGLRDCQEDKDMDGQVDAPVTGMQGIFTSESNFLKVDTDDDGLTDTQEARDGWPYRTNPAKFDTDDDGLWDGQIDENHSNMTVEPEKRDVNVEDRNKDGMFGPSADLSGQGCGPNVIGKDTDPRKADTDGDGLTDKQELANAQQIDQANFKVLISDPAIWGEGGIPAGSNPNAKDSDGDGLMDNQEYNGSVITYYDSNPCMPDSDGDIKLDSAEQFGCQLNPDNNCLGSDVKDSGSGLDSDGDGEPDDAEAKLGTDPLPPNGYDTDKDGVKDGDEDRNHNGTYEPNLGETDAKNPDTDGDGLSDGMEMTYGTDPTNIDSDGDCIPDGPMTIVDRSTGQQIQSSGEDVNGNGHYDEGSETNANSPDTDGDGLPDGWVASSGLGEDLNCSGTRDIAADGHFTETDPRNPDSDMDGIGDYEEMTQGGYFNLSNIDRASTGREGCSIAGTSAGTAPSSIFFLMMGLLAAVKGIAIRMRKTPA